MDCSPPGPSVHGDSPGKNTGVGSHFLLQGIFLTQGLNPGLCTAGRFFRTHPGPEATWVGPGALFAKPSGHPEGQWSLRPGLLPDGGGGQGQVGFKELPECG